MRVVKLNEGFSGEGNALFYLTVSRHPQLRSRESDSSQAARASIRGQGGDLGVLQHQVQ